MIYFILDRKNKVVKIGKYTKGKLAIRLSGLQVGNVHLLEVIGVQEGERCEEAELHEKFIDLRVRGEWFVYKRPLEEYIKRNTNLDIEDEKLPVKDRRTKKQWRKYWETHAVGRGKDYYKKVAEKNRLKNCVVDIKLLDNYFEISPGSILTTGEIKEYLAKYNILGSSGRVMPVTKVADYFKLEIKYTSYKGKAARVVRDLAFKL